MLYFMEMDCRFLYRKLTHPCLALGEGACNIMGICPESIEMKASYSSGKEGSNLIRILNDHYSLSI